jgi:YjbE family integral membrane protein
MVDMGIKSGSPLQIQRQKQDLTMLQTFLASFSDPATFGKVLEIIVLNIILSGDNAVVIALACRGLPPQQRNIGIALGAGVAVLLRVVFTVLIASLLNTPFLRIAGALLLLWIAVKLLTDENEENEDNIKSSDKLFKAVQTVAIADIVMSLDNVLAIAAVAKDSIGLLILGLVISIPLIVVGASLITSLLTRFPILIWVGAGLLGWVAGEMLVSDPWLIEKLGKDVAHKLEYPAAAAGALFVIAVGYFIKKKHAGKPEGA